MLEVKFQERGGHSKYFVDNHVEDGQEIGMHYPVTFLMNGRWGDGRREGEG